MWIQKYLLTCGFVCARVDLVPESACQPGLETESAERRLHGKPGSGGKRKTDSDHEAEAVPGGARSHVLLSTESPGNRRQRARGHSGLRTRKHPNCDHVQGKAALSDGTVYRVSVNSVEGHGSGNRQPGPKEGDGGSGNRTDGTAGGEG